MIVPRLRCDNRLMRKDSDHRARPTAIRSVLRYVQPIAARTKATRARMTRMTLRLKFMSQSSSIVAAGRSPRLPAGISQVIPLQCLELAFAHLGRVLRPAQQDDGVRVQPHGAR